MSNASKFVVQGPSIGFFGLLTIVFIVLKLTHYIDWSWIWVLSPLWIPTTLFLIFCVGLLALWIWANTSRRY